ncbi:SdpI family protein [uncultured Brevundimonas sp.]|uniref:SdpI family protein n=1 Tax=uncultured Brevundimonas sp. TaxID=213418 RepID=UPI0030ECD883|tara:strand:+ start:4651 stop:5325 length:675 start_codon:yes stop_codon:yes gene_type:complete
MTAANRAPAIDLATWGISILIIGTGLGVLIAGPTELMPVHWNIRGDADDWAGRELVGLMIAGLGLLNLLLAGGLGLFAARADDPARHRALRFGQLVVLLAMTGVTLFAGGSSLSGAVTIRTAIPMAGLSLIFLLFGAFLGRVGPNPVVGVRTPWTYKSRLAWDRSNRLAGRLLFLIGLIGLVTAPWAIQPFALIAVITAVIVAAVWSVIESWRVWRTDPDRQPF